MTREEALRAAADRISSVVRPITYDTVLDMRRILMEQGFAAAEVQSLALHDLLDLTRYQLHQEGLL